MARLRPRRSDTRSNTARNPASRPVRTAAHAHCNNNARSAPPHTSECARDDPTPQSCTDSGQPQVMGPRPRRGRSTRWRPASTTSRMADNDPTAAWAHKARTSGRYAALRASSCSSWRSWRAWWLPAPAHAFVGGDARLHRCRQLLCRQPLLVGGPAVGSGPIRPCSWRRLRMRIWARCRSRTHWTSVRRSWRCACTARGGMSIPLSSPRSSLRASVPIQAISLDREPWRVRRDWGRSPSPTPATPAATTPVRSRSHTLRTPPTPHSRDIGPPRLRVGEPRWRTQAALLRAVPTQAIHQLRADTSIAMLTTVPGAGRTGGFG
jgi:hypothetical protein